MGAIAGGDGLAISAGGTTVKGLAITDFANGIHVTSNGGDVITGDFLGTDASGRSIRGRQPDSAYSSTAAGQHDRRDLQSASRNLISGNSLQGVLIDDGSSANTILGNLSAPTPPGEAWPRCSMAQPASS